MFSKGMTYKDLILIFGAIVAALSIGHLATSLVSVVCYSIVCALILIVVTEIVGDIVDGYVHRRKDRHEGDS